MDDSTSKTTEQLIQEGLEPVVIHGGRELWMPPLKIVVMSRHFTMLNFAIESYKRSITGEFNRADEEPKSSTLFGDIASCILYGVSFLEAGINIVFELVDRNIHLLSFTEEQKENFKLINILKEGKSIESIPTLEKYRIFHRILLRENPDNGSRIYQDIDLIIKLRNLLAHPKIYGFHRVGEDKKIIRDSSKLVAALGQRYTLDGSSAIYDDPLEIVLNTSCAKWTIISIVQFWNYYCHKILESGLAETSERGLFAKASFDPDHLELALDGGGFIIELRTILDEAE